jgi:uncharacterized protein (DUF1501 family)
MKTRREFLKLTSNYAALAGFSSMMSPLSLFAEEATLTGYKALVVVLQHGGNDSISMLIPSGSDIKKGYANYASVRSTLAVSDVDLTSQLSVTDNVLTVGSGSSNPYYQNGEIAEAYTKGLYRHANIDGLATSGMMPEFAHLVNEGNIAMVANVGNLRQPTTKTEMTNKTAVLPPFLYSHNSQRKLTFNGDASTLNREGWAGLIADDWLSVNGGSIYGMNISLKGVSHLLYGQSTEPLILNPKAPTEYSNINRTVYNDLLDEEKNEIFKALYNTKRKHSFATQDTLVSDWDTAGPTLSSTNAYGGELFSLPTNTTLGISNQDKVGSGLLTQLKAVAKLAYIGKNRGLKRQVFYVVQGGYDTHSNQAEKHSGLLRELSLGLGDLQTALKEMGMENEVTTFNISDFGRSVGNNGDGTDHAWGAHHFVMGGAVAGGLYGTLPDLTLDGEDDASKKGRLIPTTSMSQYLGTIVKWFGADEAMLNEIFPERVNFTEKDLGFMGS